jgi:class 3 adenylate cyclase/predicted ATPase/DNA-binding XRE family transcriptional regulator
MSETDSTSTFGQLLREYRIAAGLTQEALAERAGVGTRSIQRLERGLIHPQRDTLRALLRGLPLSAEQSRQLEGAVQPGPRRRGSRPALVAVIGSPGELASTGAPVPEAERRQLTMLAAGLTDSDDLSERIDPEDLSDVLRVFQDAATEVIRRFEGSVVRCDNNGMLAYFGYPAAREDDTRRAIDAGLAIVDQAAEWKSRMRTSVPVTIQVGIHTGLVVVGGVEKGQAGEGLTVVGEPLNVAAALQNLASPNEVAISGATHRLVQRFFSCESRGLHQLAGRSRSIEVYRVIRAVDGRPGFDQTTWLTRLVGRAQELALLLDRWDRAREGGGQVVLLSGEPGIGKSRLVQEAIARVEDVPHQRLTCFCSPYSQNSPLYPVIDLFQRLLQFADHESLDEKLRKIEDFVVSRGFTFSEAIPLLAALLSVPLSERYPPLGVSADKQKQLTLECCLHLVLTLAERQPVHLVVEGLHWADPSTLELLDLLIEQVPTAPVLCIFTFRPEFRPPWPVRAHLAHVALDRLTHGQAELMVGQVAAGQAVPSEVLRQVAARTDGVPLFVEELTKAFLESGRESIPLIPTTLHASLMARLDRLGPAKEVAQLGSALGREFTFELLLAVSPLDPLTLQRELTRLVEAGLLYQRGIAPRATFFFKHALIQDAAYQSLLRRTRQRYHEQIARALIERFPEMAEMQPELLAHHLTEGDLLDEAIVQWQKAGQRAIERSAYREAVHHFSRGLELLATRPDRSTRVQQELTIQAALAGALKIARGWAAPEAGRAYDRALELCRQLGDAPELFTVLHGLWEYYEVGGQMAPMREVAEQLLGMAERAGDLALLMEAHHALGETLVMQGEFADAVAHFEQGIAIYNPVQHHSLAQQSGSYDVGVACRAFVAWPLWLLGYPEQARAKSEQACILAGELAHPFSATFAISLAALVHQHGREISRTRESAEEVIARATRLDSPFFIGLGSIVRGWALAMEEDGRQPLREMSGILATWRAGGSEVLRPWFLSMLAEAHAQVGEPEQGLEAIAEALAVIENGGERTWEAELYRLQGSLLLMLSPPDDPKAEVCFRRALDVAREQQAKSLELRAAASRYRLARRTTRVGSAAAIEDDARRTLQATYDWFTEGFDTPDLKDARALLQSRGTETLKTTL